MTKEDVVHWLARDVASRATYADYVMSPVAAASTARKYVEELQCVLMPTLEEIRAGQARAVTLEEALDLFVLALAHAVIAGKVMRGSGVTALPGPLALVTDDAQTSAHDDTTRNDGHNRVG